MGTKPDVYQFIVYRGNNDAWKGYFGATVYTRCCLLPVRWSAYITVAERTSANSSVQGQQRCLEGLLWGHRVHQVLPLASALVCLNYSDTTRTEDECKFIVYRGNNDAWKGYFGATVYTRCCLLPARMCACFTVAMTRIEDECIRNVYGGSKDAWKRYRAAGEALSPKRCRQSAAQTLCASDEAPRWAHALRRQDPI